MTAKPLKSIKISEQRLQLKKMNQHNSTTYYCTLLLCWNIKPLKAYFTMKQARKLQSIVLDCDIPATHLTKTKNIFNIYVFIFC